VKLVGQLLGLKLGFGSSNGVERSPAASVEKADDAHHVHIEQGLVEHGVHGVVAERLSQNVGQQLQHRRRGSPLLGLGSAFMSFGKRQGQRLR
jgi:hypothetical protein